MNSFELHLNDLLVRAYRSLEIIEEASLKKTRNLDLTIGEIHLLETVGPPAKDKTGKTVSEISDSLGITVPSGTLAINKLVKKGYLEKQKSDTDGRVVYVRLTRAGQKAEHAHRFFHRSMVRTISEDMSESEKEVLLKAMSKMNGFFEENIQRSRRSK